VSLTLRRRRISPEEGGEKTTTIDPVEGKGGASTQIAFCEGLGGDSVSDGEGIKIVGRTIDLATSTPPRTLLEGGGGPRKSFQDERNHYCCLINANVYAARPRGTGKKTQRLVSPPREGKI